MVLVVVGQGVVVGQIFHLSELYDGVIRVAKLLICRLNEIMIFLRFVRIVSK